jgi:ubiquinone/menaquinone biosynthesis C-methylase UbiE
MPCAGVLRDHQLQVYADLSMTAPLPHTTGRVLHWAFGYDVLVWLLTYGRADTFRNRLVALAHIVEGEHVLDIGCGTGSLAIAAKRYVGRTGRVVGIDASAEMIARAKRKAARARMDVTFENAVAERLPFRDAEFDVVLSTLMLHHLPRPVRERCANEIRRVLKRGGRALVVDFAKAQEKKGILAHFHRHGHVAPADIVSLLEKAGFGIGETGAVGVSTLQFVLASTGSGTQ